MTLKFKPLFYFISTLLSLCYSNAISANTNSITTDIINYDFPIRQYSSCSTRYTIVYERDINPQLDERSLNACKVLEQRIDKILSVYPPHTTEYLQSINYFVLVGEDAALGGQKSSLRYVRPNEANAKNQYDSRWQNAIIIYSSKNYLYLDELWQTKSVAHEMAHAWHIKNWPERYLPIYQAWRNAQHYGLYLDVQDYKNRTINKAYALQNQLEYFAEISVAYFFKINYFPFNHKGLAQYDPVGFQMIETLWQIYK